MYPDNLPIQFEFENRFDEDSFLDFEDRETKRYVERERDNAERRISNS